MWKSLFLPLGADEKAVFASHFDPKPSPCSLTTTFKCDPQQSPAAATSILTVLSNQEIVIFGLDSAAKGPYVRSRIKPPADMKRGMRRSAGTNGGSDAKADGKPIEAICATLFPFLIPTPDRAGPADTSTHPIEPPSNGGSFISRESTFDGAARVGNIQEDGATPPLSQPTRRADPLPKTRGGGEPFAPPGRGREKAHARVRSQDSDSTIVEVGPAPGAEATSQLAQLSRRLVGAAQSIFTPAERDDPRVVDARSDDDGSDGTDAPVPVGSTRAPLAPEAYEKWLKTRVYRGAVGSSNGRIDVFTADRYVMGFQAHDCPVIAVRGIIDESESAALSSSASPQSSSIPAAAQGGRGGAKGAVTGGRSDGFFADSQAASQWVLQRITFVTQGADGSIYVWRRSQHVDGYARRVHFRASFLKTIAAFDAKNGVIVTPGPSFSTAIELCTPSGATAEKQVLLQGTFQTTSAVALDGHRCLAARGNVVYGIDYNTKMVHRLLTTDSDVTYLYVAMPYAVAGCANGRLIFFSAEDGAILSGGAKIRRPRTAWRDPTAQAEAKATEAVTIAVGTASSVFCTYGSSLVQSLTMHRFSMTAVVVDKDLGVVEVAQLPEEFLRCRCANPPARQLAQGAVLARLIALDEAATNPTAEAALTEALILSRYLVPDELAQYCGRQTKII